MAWTTFGVQPTKKRGRLALTSYTAWQMRFCGVKASASRVAAVAIILFLSPLQMPRAGAAETITDSAAQCASAVEAEKWSDAVVTCSAIVRRLSDMLAAAHDVSKTDRLALEEGIVTYAALTAHAAAKTGDLSNARFYIFIATKELEIATSDGLSVDSGRYRELKGAIDTAQSDLPAKQL